MQIQRIYRCEPKKERKRNRVFIPDVRTTRSPLIHEGLGVCPLWGSCGGGGRRAGIRVIPSDLEELKVPVQFVIKCVVGVGGFEIFPVLAEDAEVVRGHCIPAKVGHGLEVVVQRWLSEFGWWERGYSRDGWEDFVAADLACKQEENPVSTS